MNAPAADMYDRLRAEVLAEWRLRFWAATQVRKSEEYVNKLWSTECAPNP